MERRSKRPVILCTLAIIILFMAITSVVVVYVVQNSKKLGDPDQAFATRRPLNEVTNSGKEKTTKSVDPALSGIVQLVERICLSCFYPNLGIDLSKCPNPHWVGDGYCDEKGNVEECNFDSGDCCLPDPDLSYCQVCSCLDRNTTDCPAPGKVGDYVCDEILNIPACDFDGLDCGKKIWLTFLRW